MPRSKSSKSKKSKSKSKSTSMLKVKSPPNVKGYCVVCKQKGVTMKKCVFKKNKNGSVMARGQCSKPSCGANMTTFLSSSFLK